MFGLKNSIKQPSVLQIFISVLHNGINNFCVVSECKLFTKICICNIYTIVWPETIGIFFTVRVPNLKRECTWNSLTFVLCKIGKQPVPPTAWDLALVEN